VTEGCGEVNISHIKWLSAFAAVLLAADAALAQDFTAGKTPAQLFASDCSACHRLPNGLGKKYDVAGLSGFLREHYTTKPDSAGALAKYVMGFANLRAMPTTAPSVGDTVAARPAEEPKARRRTSNLSGDGVKPPRSPVAAAPPAAAAEAVAVEAVVQPTAATPKPVPERGVESETSPPVAKLNDYARSGVAVVPREVAPREVVPPEAAPREADDPLARIRAYATSGAGPQEAAAQAPTPASGTSRRGSAARGAKPAPTAVVAPAPAPAVAPVAPAASMPPPAPL
jgi:hypothetical protein